MLFTAVSTEYCHIMLECGKNVKHEISVHAYENISVA